ncbi:MAG: flagellar type III secretion system pore protein FliP [Pseudomonadota bacterium]
MTRALLLAAMATLCCVAGPAVAQDVAIDFGDQSSLTTRTVQLIALLTVLSLAPGIAITVTCFPFIVTVLSILRQAIGLQASPPNMLIVSLAMFLTYFVMEPVFTEAWIQGLQPLSNGDIAAEDAFVATLEPFRAFMAARVDPETLEHLASLRPDAPDGAFSVLVPSFLLSEISRAFQIGFLVFMPFLIIDMVAAAVLMSMGMMMVPPAIVSLPFKLAFFVVVDGWTLVSGALVRSYI